MQNQQQHCIKPIDFCLEQDQMEPEHCQQQQTDLVRQPQSAILQKKYSINTASSFLEQDDQQLHPLNLYTKQQLGLSNIELLEKQTGFKVDSGNQLYPSSFSLINLPKKNQTVTLKELMEFNFSVLSHSIQDLVRFSTEIIWSNGYAKKIFTKDKMEELILCIASSYNRVSYHNFSHAFSLMQLNFQCVELLPSFKAHFTEEQLFYTLVSGISHDLNHRGTNNMFEVKRKTDLALTYNNESVLENMHISMLWKILRQNPKLNFLKLSKNQTQTKEIITKLILSTDMSSHFKNLESLQKRRKQNNINLKKFEDRMFMMQQIFHSCDLGNPTLEYDSYISWAALLSHQFNEQAKMEKFYGIEVTKNFEYKNFSTLYNDQVWFVGKIVHPLWKEICLHLPELNILKRRIEENTEKLNQKLTEEQLKART